MKMFADSMFVTLREKGIKNLIIDLRNNGGGNSMVGDVLFPLHFSQRLLSKWARPWYASRPPPYA